MNISEKIKAVRKQNKISQSEMAEKIGLQHQSNYARFENRGKKLSFAELEKIAEALGVSVKYLLFGEEETLNDNEKMMVEMLQQRIKDLENTIKDKDKIIKLLENK